MSRMPRVGEEVFVNRFPLTRKPVVDASHNVIVSVITGIKNRNAKTLFYA